MELVVIFPVVLLLIFGAVQAGLFFYARSVALSVAQEALTDARVETGSVAAGIARGQQFLAAAGGDGVLPGGAVSASRSATTVTITVTGTAPSALPGISGLPVTQTVSGPVERVTEP